MGGFSVTMMTEQEIRARVKELKKVPEPLHKLYEEYHIDYWACPYCRVTGTEAQVSGHIKECHDRINGKAIQELLRVLGKAS